MFSTLRTQNTAYIGKHLITDINIELFNAPDEQLPIITERLKLSGYQYLIGAVSHHANPRYFLRDITLPIRTVKLYDVEKDLQHLQAFGQLETLGSDYVLIQANWLIPISDLEDAIALLKNNGYRPVLIRAERYACLQDNYRNISRLLHKGCLFELEIISLTGHRGLDSKRLAQRLFKYGPIHFIGSGIHNLEEQVLVETLFQSRKLAKRLLSLPLGNKNLWETPMKNMPYVTAPMIS